MFTVANYLFWGIYVFEIRVFTDTHFGLILLILIGWGLAQISFAYFLSCFMSRSSTAALAGYGIAVVLMV